MILLYFKQKYKGFLPLCMKDNIIKISQLLIGTEIPS